MNVFCLDGATVSVSISIHSHGRGQRERPLPIYEHTPWGGHLWLIYSTNKRRPFASLMPIGDHAGGGGGGSKITICT